MTQIHQIPAVWSARSGAKVQAAVALKLSSLLLAELLRGVNDTSRGDGATRTNMAYKAQWVFLQALAAWPANILVELHWTALPDLKMPSNGRLEVTLFLRAWEKDRESAVTGVLDGFFRLKPLLSTGFRHLAFTPVKDVHVVQHWMAPFEAAGAVRIDRKRKRVSLCRPVKHTSLGFGPRQTSDESELSIDHCFPWVPMREGTDHLVSVLMQQLDYTQLIVRLSPAAGKQKDLDKLRATVQACDRYLAREQNVDLTLTEQARQLRALALRQLVALTDGGFRTGVFWVSAAPMSPQAAAVLSGMLLAPTSALGHDNSHSGGFVTKTVPVGKARQGTYVSPDIITTAEAAAVFQLPTSPLQDLPGLPIQRWRTAMAAAGGLGRQPSEGVELFDNVHQSVTQPIGLANHDRLTHMALFGGSGTGKSTLMANMVLADIDQGRGVSVLDPHGSLVDSILGRIPQCRWQDVILFDIADRERPIGFNLLQWQTIEERDLIIEDIFMCMDVMYDHKLVSGPIFENNYRNMMTLLCGDTESRHLRNGFTGTVIDFCRCYLDSGFRTFLVETIGTNEVKDFVTELERTRGEAQLCNLAPYITSKFSRFTTDITLRRVFGQERTGLNFDEIIDRKKIFLVKLGRGQFGESVCSLLAAMILSRLKMAAMQRGPLASFKGREHFIYVDEAGLLPGYLLGALLSEIRKFGIGLVLGSQYTRQLTSTMSATRKDTLLDSVNGNVGTVVAFRLGKDDANEMGALFWPVCSMLDIVRLPNFCGYCKISAGHRNSPPFSFRSRPLQHPYRDETAERLRHQSRFAYGTPADQVDQLILARR